MPLDAPGLRVRGRLLLCRALVVAVVAEAAAARTEPLASRKSRRLQSTGNATAVAFRSPVGFVCHVLLL